MMASVNDHESKITNLVNTKNVLANITHFSITGTIDADTVADNTVYHVRGSITNAPLSNYGELITFNPGTRHQFYISDLGGVYYRVPKNSATWSKFWVQGDAITNAVWNDYAERFEKPLYLKTEPGDIISLDKSYENEMYKLAIEGDTNIVGIHSDEYGMLIGGTGDEEYDKENFIPVGMMGRVKCKIIGKINKGDRVVPSNIAGVGRKYNKETDDLFSIIGFATETSYDENIKKVRIKINTY